MKKLQWVDGLRSIALMLIFMYHYYTRLCYNDMNNVPIKNIPILWENGHIAVDFFFLLSGFISAYVYIEKVKDMSFYNYFNKRVIKIYPQIICSNLLAAGIIVVDNYIVKSNILNEGLTVSKCIKSILLIPRNINADFPINEPLWFIDVLVALYLLFFFVIKLASKLNVDLTNISIVLVVLGLTCYERKWNIPFFNSRGVMAFYLGVIIFLNSDKIKKKLPIIILTIFSVLIVVMANKYGVEKVMGDIKLTCSLFVFPTILLFVIKNNIIQKVFSCFIFKEISKLSFGFYLTHQVVIDTARWVSVYFGMELQVYRKYFFFISFLTCLIIAKIWSVIFNKNK